MLGRDFSRVPHLFTSSPVGLSFDFARQAAIALSHGGGETCQNRKTYILPLTTTSQVCQMQLNQGSGTGQYWDPEQFYRYHSRSYSPLESTYSVRGSESYGSGKDISQVLSETDPWKTSSSRSYFGAPDGAYLGLPELGHGLASGEKTTSVASFSDSSSDPLERFLTSKGHFLAWSARDNLRLIYDREKLHYGQMRRMEGEKSNIRSGLIETDNWRVGHHTGMDRRRDTLESQLASLEREGRSHEVATWRDTARLRSDLREIVGELEAERRKWGFLKPDYR